MLTRDDSCTIFSFSSLFFLFYWLKLIKRRHDTTESLKIVTRTNALVIEVRILLGGEQLNIKKIEHQNLTHDGSVDAGYEVNRGKSCSSLARNKHKSNIQMNEQLLVLFSIIFREMQGIKQSTIRSKQTKNNELCL